MVIQVCSGQVRKNMHTKAKTWGSQMVPGRKAVAKQELSDDNIVPLV